MADVERSVVIKMGLDFGDAVKSAKGFGDTAGKALDDVDKALSDVNNRLDVATRFYDRAAKSAEQHGSTASVSANKLGQALVKTGEGAFTLARGIAFLTTSTDEGFKDVIETVAKVQGAFDLFKGSVQIVRGLDEAQKSLKISAAAAALSETSLAVAQDAAAASAGRQAAATSAAAASARLLGLATTPLGAVLLAVGAIATGVWLKYKHDAAEAREEAEEHGRSLAKLIALERVRFDQQLIASRLQTQGAAERFSALQREAQILLQINEADAVRLAQSEQGRNAGRANEAIRRELGLEEPGALESRIVRPQDIFESDRGTEDKIAAFGRLTQSLEEQAGWLEIQRAANEGILQGMRDRLSLAEAEVEKAQQLVREEEKRMGLAEEIGRLSATQLAELNNLSEKVKQGFELTADELRRLEQLAPQIAGKFVGREFAEKGEQAAEGLTKIFEVDPTEAEAALEKARRDVEQIQAKVDQAAADIIRANNNAADRLIDIFNQLAVIPELVARLETTLQINQAANR